MSQPKQELGSVHDQVRAAEQRMDDVCAEERDHFEQLEHGGLSGLGATEGSPFAMQLGWCERVELQGWLIYPTLVGLVALALS